MSHSQHPSSGGSPESIAAGHELTDVKIAPLLQFAVMLTVIVVVTMWCMMKAHVWMEDFFKTRENVPHPMQTSGVVPAGPRLQVNEAKDLAAYNARIEANFTGYAWIDRPANVVRVPIPRAMELVLEKGLPHRQSDKK